jgi:hypothetical protein
MSVPGYVWLNCEVLNVINERNVEVQVQLQDGTSGKLTVGAVCLDSLENPCRLKVEHRGEQQGLVYVELPAPTLNFGHNITVKKEDITAATFPVPANTSEPGDVRRAKRTPKAEDDADRIIQELRKAEAKESAVTKPRTRKKP